MRLPATPRADEIVAHRRGAAGTERDVVFARAALVGVALDDEGVARILDQPLDLTIERGDRLRRELGGIGQEEDPVADIDDEFLGAAGRRRGAR